MYPSLSISELYRQICHNDFSLFVSYGVHASQPFIFRAALPVICHNDFSLFVSLRRIRLSFSELYFVFFVDQIHSETRLVQSGFEVIRPSIQYDVLCHNVCIIILWDTSEFWQ